MIFYHLFNEADRIKEIPRFILKANIGYSSKQVSHPDMKS